MEIITSDSIIKGLRKNALCSALISTAIFVVVTMFAILLITDGNKWFSIVLFIFDIPMIILTIKLWTTFLHIKLSNIAVIKDTLIAKSNEMNDDLRTGEMFAFCGEFQKSGKIKLLQNDYDNLEVDESYHLIFLSGQTLPIAVYNTRKYKLDKELKKQIQK